MPLRLMIDSGAFSVWNKGAKIDLDEYIRFCRARPNLSVIVGLDVIPPKGAVLTNELKHQVAKEGWDNYMKMIRVLPMDKVVPVFHRGDDVSWLEKYLDFGCPYIGLAPRVDNSDINRRFKFLTDCRKMLLGSDGKPIVKTHGFAVTNHKMMQMFPWYSVDSASWILLAGWGKILVPQRINGQWDFTRQPYRVMVSTEAPRRTGMDMNLLSMQTQRPIQYQVVLDWLDECGVGLGVHEAEPANGRKPKKQIERWMDRRRTHIVKIKERGVTNCDQVRRWINGKYFHHVNDALPIEHLYLAGQGPIPYIEEQMRYRLKSFVDSKLETEWMYKRIGQLKRPMQFPFDKYNKEGPTSFSFKE